MQPKEEESKTNASENIKYDEEGKIINVISALLDFYADRTTSFASLFVASIFGLVTVLAIVQGMERHAWSIYLSVFAYLFFAISGGYTLMRYSFYADTASVIEMHGLRQKYRKELVEVKWIAKEKEWNLDKYLNEHMNARERKERKIINDLPTKVYFIVYAVLITLLGLMVYLPLLT